MNIEWKYFGDVDPLEGGTWYKVDCGYHVSIIELRPDDWLSPTDAYCIMTGDLTLDALEDATRAQSVLGVCGYELITLEPLVIKQNGETFDGDTAFQLFVESAIAHGYFIESDEYFTTDRHAHNELLERHGIQSELMRCNSVLSEAKNRLT